VSAAAAATREPWLAVTLSLNRDNSNHSRYFGPILESQIMGRAYKVYWPLDRAGPLR
jgi:type IV secretory pathway protease TraF